MAKKVYNSSEIKAKTAKPKSTTREIKRSPIMPKKETQKPAGGLDSYAYGLDNNIILL